MQAHLPHPKALALRKRAGRGEPGAHSISPHSHSPKPPLSSFPASTPSTPPHLSPQLFRQPLRLLRPARFLEPLLSANLGLSPEFAPL